MKKTLNDIFTLCSRELKLYWRIPHQIVISSLIPFVWLIIQGSTFAKAKEILKFSAPDYLTFLGACIVGALVLECTLMLSINILRDRINGYYRKLLVFPISRSSIMVGCIIPLIYKTVVPIWFLFGCLFLIGVNVTTGIIGFLLINLLVVIAGIGFSCMGLMFAMVSKDESIFFALLSFFKLPITMLTFGFYPASFAPNWLNTIAKYNPLTYLIVPVRSLIVENAINWVQLWNCAGILCIFSLISFIVSYLIFDRSYAL